MAPPSDGLEQSHTFPFQCLAAEDPALVGSVAQQRLSLSEKRGGKLEAEVLLLT